MIGRPFKISEELGILILKLRELGLGQRPIAKILETDRSTIQNFYLKNNIITPAVKNRTKKATDLILNSSEVLQITEQIKVEIEKISYYECPPEEKVIEMIRSGLGTAKVAQLLNASEYYVFKIYEKLELTNEEKTKRISDTRMPRTAHLMTEKKCAVCKNILGIENFFKQIRKDGRTKYRSYCFSCCLIVQARYVRNRRNNDHKFWLKGIISKQVNDGLQRYGKTKNGQSSIENLPYSIKELYDHIEKLFSHPDNLTPDGKVWMTWENRGVWNTKTWDDNDPSTWTWQLDHIIPHSEFHYEDMTCRAFLDCWALSNLRPLNAKQNQLDGIYRTRHLK